MNGRANKWLGDINSAIAVAKSPVMEDGRMRDNQATTEKIRFMSHVSPSDRTQKPAKKKKKKKSQRGKILDHRPCLLSLSTYCISSSRLSLSFLSLMHTEGKTQTFLSPPPGERVNGPLIPRSEDQSQQGGHVCQIKKKKNEKKKRGWLC